MHLHFRFCVFFCQQSFVDSQLKETKTPFEDLKQKYQSLQVGRVSLGSWEYACVAFLVAISFLFLDVSFFSFGTPAPPELYEDELAGNIAAAAATAAAAAAAPAASVLAPGSAVPAANATANTPANAQANGSPNALSLPSVPPAPILASSSSSLLGPSYAADLRRSPFPPQSQHACTIFLSFFSVIFCYLFLALSLFPLFLPLLISHFSLFVFSELPYQFGRTSHF